MKWSPGVGVLLSIRQKTTYHSPRRLIQQLYAADYVQLLQGAGAAMSMTNVGAAWQNGYAERLIRTIKEEEVYLSDYHDYHDAYQQIGCFLDDVYMLKRIHSSL